MYASHRQNLEQVILAGNPGGSICVLGAGNCNDLDLNWLTQIFQQVHLVDLDVAALEDGARRQRQESSARIRLHAPVDLSGIADLIGQWQHSPPKDADIDQCFQRIKQPLQIDTGLRDGSSGFDVVLSPCVLSQLLISVREAIGSEHPRYPALRSALRQRHFNVMSQLLAPRGRGILAVDVASTENFPGLAQARESDLSDLMRALIGSGKCFRALAPDALRAAMGQVQEIRQPAFTRPWRWRLGLSKAFLVYGVTFQKTSSLNPCQDPSDPRPAYLDSASL